MNEVSQDDFLSIWQRTQKTFESINTFCELWNIPKLGGTVQMSDDLHRIYQIQGILGVGGRAIVYDAEEIKDSPNGSATTKVAIKMLRPDLVDSTESDQPNVFSEIELMATVGECPRVIGVKDHGVDMETELPFYTMRYLEDCRSLKDYITEKGSLSCKEAVRLLDEIAVAVEKLHEKDIVHRDLKLANVLVCNEGGRPSAYLADFSTAQRVDRAHGLVGSVYNQPPEQVLSGEFTKQSDIYALGTMLYEITTDHKPYEEGWADQTAILMRIKDPLKNPTPLRQHRRNIPNQIEHICNTCMNYAQQKRYQEVSTVREDLKAFQANNPLPSMPYYHFRLGWKRGRLPILFSLLFAAIFYLIVREPDPIPIASIEKDVQTATDNVIFKLKVSFQPKSLNATVTDLLNNEMRDRLRAHLAALKKVDKDSRLALLENKIRCLLAVSDPSILSVNETDKLLEFLAQLYLQLAKEQHNTSRKIERIELDASIYVLAGRYWFSRRDWGQAINQLEKYADLVRNVPENVKLLTGIAYLNEGAKCRREENELRAEKLFEKAFKIYQEYGLKGSVDIPIKKADNGFPEGWWLHQREGTATVDVLSEKDGFDRPVNVLSLNAKKASYALYRLVTLPNPKNYELQWEWKVDRMPENPNFDDWQKRGDPEQLGNKVPTRPRKEYLTNQPIQLIVGFYRIPKPVALQYSWDPSAAVNTFYTDEEDPGEDVKRITGGTIQVPTFILESGEKNLGRWVSVRRDIAKDFQKVYPGEPIPTVGLIAVQINSQFAKNPMKDVAESMIRSIRFVKKKNVAHKSFPQPLVRAGKPGTE